MKKIVFSLVLCALISLSSEAFGQDKVSGTIYYKDGNSQPFTEFRSLYKKDYTGSQQYFEFEMDYNNTRRNVPYSKMKEIVLQSCIIEPGPNYIAEVVLKATTKTGVVSETKFYSLKSIYVMINDELTGDQVQQAIDFVHDNKVVIDKIVFD